MNDYFLKSMIRQRHEQISDEVAAARLSRLDRPRLNCQTRKITRTFFSRIGQWTRPKALREPAIEEGKYV